MQATAIDTRKSDAPGEPWWARRRLILVASLVLIPIALSLGFNSYGPLTTESALRMAFATIAGATIAILGTLFALGITLTRRRNVAGVIAFALLTVVVVAYEGAVMGSAGDLLLQRLALVAETASLG